MIDLREFSNIVKDVMSNNIDDFDYAFVNQLPLGETNYNFRFSLEEKQVRIISPLRSLPTAFEIANLVTPQKDYTLSMRILSEGKTSTISKSAPAKIKVDKLKEEVLTGTKADRIFYEILTTDDFEITFSEYEGTIVRFKDESIAKRFMQLLVGLFPYGEFKKENKNVEVHCKFAVEKYDGLKKGIQKKGKLSCKVIIDGYPAGTRLSSFFF